MTLVAGFFCSDGLLMCADMEETTATSKRKLNKLFYRNASGHQMVFTGAGSAAVIDNAIKRLDDAVRKAAGTLGEEAMEDLIDRALYDVHEKYVWRSQQDHGIQLLIGYANGQALRLWYTEDIVPAPEAKYACRGIGQDLANYFADRLYHPFYTKEQMVKLATFIFKEVKQNVWGVGQGTTMWLLPRYGQQALAYNEQEIAALETTLPDFDGMLREYREKMIGPLFPDKGG